MKKYLPAILIILSFYYVTTQAKPCSGDDYEQWNNCLGSYTWSDGAQYTGRWKNGSMNGYGSYIFGGDNVWSVKSYIGFYKNDDMHGYGKITWLDGGYYEGDWYNNDPHGYGTHVYSDGRQFVGYYKQGRPDGNGKFTWPDGSYYSGAWKNGDHEGYGVFSYTNGDLYEGYFKSDLKDGQGTFTYADGSVYRGEWKNDKKLEKDNSEKIASTPSQCPEDENLEWTNCYGEYKYTNGNRYSGLWDANDPHGKGVLYFPNGEKLSASFKSHLANGDGKYYFNNGDIYDGEFKDSLLHGLGTITKKDGSIMKAKWYEGELEKITVQFVNSSFSEALEVNGEYIINCPTNPKAYWNNCNGSAFVGEDRKYTGTWRDDKPHGFGELFEDEILTYQGFFVNGGFHGKGKLYFSEGMVFEGYFEDDEKHGEGFYYDSASKAKAHNKWINGEAVGDFTFIEEDGSTSKLRLEDGKFVEVTSKETSI